MDIKYEVILTEKAKRELSEIYDYISKSLMAEKAANNFINKLRKSILMLQDMPEICSRLEQYIDKKYRYRKLVINNYVAIYRVDKKNKKVYIVRIVYGGRNYLNEL